MKRKEFLMSLGLIGLAPKLLSKDAESASIDNGNLITFAQSIMLETRDIEGMKNLSKGDIIFITEPDIEIYPLYKIVAQGYIWNFDLVTPLGSIGEMLIHIQVQNLPMEKNKTYSIRHYAISGSNYANATIEKKFLDAKIIGAIS